MARDYKWYVVWVGNAPGVYDSWEECKLQITNYPGARYRSYPSQEKAIEAYRGDPNEEMQILRNIVSRQEAKAINYDAIPEIITDSIAVDAACSGNPGVMEYKGVYVKTGEVIFHKGPFPHGTNNIGEFLALVHALALLEQKGSKIPIYTDSKTAMAWVRNRHCKTTLTENAKNKQLLEIMRRAENWIKTHTYSNPIIKWKTDEWGEIPADFGRK